MSENPSGELQHRSNCINCSKQLDGNFTVRCKLGGFNIVSCNGCSLVQRDCVLTANQIASLYGDEYFFDAHRDYFLTYAKQKKDRFDRELIGIEKYVKSPTSILDVGCGIGTFLNAAQDRGWDTFGVDVSKEPIEYAKANTTHNLQTSNFKDALFQTNSIGAVSFWDSLNHSEFPENELREAYRVLSPGGLCIVQMNADDSLIAKLANLLYKLSRGKLTMGVDAVYTIRQSAFFSKKTLPDALQRVGFKVLETRRVPFYTPACSVRKKSILHSIAFSILNGTGNIIGLPMNIISIAQKNI